MSEKPSREERLKAIEKKMNRRDFARFTALGAVAAGMVSRAQAQEVESTGCGSCGDGDIAYVADARSEFRGDSCENFLTALRKLKAQTPSKDLKVKDILFRDMTTLIDDLNSTLNQSNKDRAVSRLLMQLRGNVETYNNNPLGKIQNATKLSVADLYVYDDRYDPRREDKQLPVKKRKHGEHDKQWRAVRARFLDEDQDAPSGDINRVRLRDYFPAAFLDLPARKVSPYDSTNDLSDRRQRIQSLITKINANDKVKDTPYLDLFDKNIYQVFGKNKEFDFDAYMLTRAAFNLGVFAGGYSTRFNSAFLTFGSQVDDNGILESPNGKCWSVTSGDCVTRNSWDYCKKVDGGPAPSSDICD